MSEPLELGHDHTLRFTCWKPDRELNPHRAHLPDVERFGAIVEHRRADGTECASGITFDGPVARELMQDRARWTVESWEPLTVSPSLLCKAAVYDADGNVIGECGDHGFIRNGRWEPA